MDGSDKKDLLRVIINCFDLYTEKREDGCWIKNTVLTILILAHGHEIKELPLDKLTLIMTAVLISHVST